MLPRMHSLTWPLFPSSCSVFEQVSYHKGTPTGKETKLGDRPCYVAGAEDADKAVLIVADVHGWYVELLR